MPIYEFTCKSCRRDCEILVRNSSRKPACPACGGTRLAKKFSLFAAQGTRSKGSGCANCASGKCSSCTTCRR